MCGVPRPVLSCGSMPSPASTSGICRSASLAGLTGTADLLRHSHHTSLASSGSNPFTCTNPEAKLIVVGGPLTCCLPRLPPLSMNGKSQAERKRCESPYPWAPVPSPLACRPVRSYLPPRHTSCTLSLQTATSDKNGRAAAQCHRRLLAAKRPSPLPPSAWHVQHGRNRCAQGTAFSDNNQSERQLVIQQWHPPSHFFFGTTTWSPLPQQSS